MPKNFRLLATILVLALFIAYFSLNLHNFRPLLDIKWILLVIIALLDLAIIAANGLFTKFIMRPFKKYISTAESFYVSLISSVGNFFAPVGAGFGFRAVYLKKRHNLAYSDYISTLAGNYIIVFLVNSLAGLLALWLLRAHTNGQFAVLVAAFGAMFVGGVILSLIRVKAKPEPKETKGLAAKIWRDTKLITQGWAYIVSHRLLMLELIGITVLNLGLSMGITGTIIAALHLHIGFSALLLFAALNSLSTFINVTPANLGIKEAVYLFSSTILGFSVSQILSIALIDRGVLFVVLAITWLVTPRIKTA